jgi:hypothetical protein
VRKEEPEHLPVGKTALRQRERRNRDPSQQRGEQQPLGKMPFTVYARRIRHHQKKEAQVRGKLQ